MYDNDSSRFVYCVVLSFLPKQLKRVLLHKNMPGSGVFHDISDGSFGNELLNVVEPENLFIFQDEQKKDAPDRISGTVSKLDAYKVQLVDGNVRYQTPFTGSSVIELISEMEKSLQIRKRIII